MPMNAARSFGALAMAVLVAAISGMTAGGATAGSKLEQISSSKGLRVCIWSGYYAISFRNPRNGELQGIDIDMSKELAVDLGVSLNYVESSFGTFMDDLDGDKCDVAMFAIGDTPARRERVDLRNL